MAETTTGHRKRARADRDAALVEAARAGDQKAFSRLVERYQTLVCSLAVAATGSVSQSEEIAQETFVSAWQNLSNLRDPHSFRSWLVGITQNRSRDSQRAKMRAEKAVSEDPSDLEASFPSIEVLGGVIGGKPFFIDNLRVVDPGVPP